MSISSSLIEKCFIASLLFSSLPGTLASVSLSGSKGTCQDFSEAACDLSENNIIHHDSFVDSPAECQVMCRDTPSCNWFSHFMTQCYLLTDCGDAAHCSGCVSGPTIPDFGNCPWPPEPSPAPTETPTTTMEETTTTTTTPTATPTTTTKSKYACPEMDVNFRGNDIFVIQDVFKWEDCAAFCLEIKDCQFWTLDDKGLHGPAHRCIPKTSDVYSHLEGHISGARGCIGK